MYTSGFFDGDAEYGQDEFNRYFNNLYESGVSIDDSGDMTCPVSNNGTTITVGAGFAIVRGFYFYNTADTALTITPDSNYTRIDRVVLRLDINSGQIIPALKAGTPASTPTAPELTRTETTWEISLAAVQITKGGVVSITDERFNTTVCGAIRPKNLTEIKTMTDEFYREFKEWFDEKIASQTWRTVYVQSNEPTGTIARGSIWIQES